MQRWRNRAPGDRFIVFNQPLLGGDALTIAGTLPAGLVWANKLAVDGSIGVVAAAPPYLQWLTTGGNNLHFTWTNTGVKLQAQTNAPGIGTNWHDYPDGASSPVDVFIDQANLAVFFRLVLP